MKFFNSKNKKVSFLIIIFFNSIVGCTHNKNLSEVNAAPYSMDLAKELDIFIDKEQSINEITGVSVTFQCPAFQKGSPKTWNIGLQSKQGLPLSDESLFQSGSIIKSMVSVIILKLEEEKKLSLNNTVKDFFPNAFEKWQNISLKQLLNMTSGIKGSFRSEYDPVKTKFFANAYYKFSTDEILNLMHEEDIKFKPGSEYYYSNTNYVLLNKIIEKVTGNGLEIELQKRIFEPLNLNNSYFIKHLPKEDIPSYKLVNLMSGYLHPEKESSSFHLKGTETTNFSLSSANGAGALISTTGDLNFYLRSLFLNNKQNNNSFFSENQLQKMMTFIDVSNGNKIPDIQKSKESIGYGLALLSSYNEIFNEREIFHTGGTFGYSSKMSYFPEKEISYVYKINSDNRIKIIEMDKVIQKYIFQQCKAN
ncbi:serine hydrolase domain-containing protein [Silvanigrella aquatica]|uniref:Beta-lactamase-related domain-containing protein n=1 Tax=Silvanigrella aquatica TaxID=1915309 RepID=A0A1L4CYB1_9BACT|nr:serine hydrolase [Silvanigrella aquatica]APJ02927.1 hypothetical protein AXG55_02940 [Silvanigrella aquatica]